MFKKLIPLLYALPILLFAFGCKDDETASTDGFDRAVLLKNISDNQILPAYQDFLDESKKLNTSAQAFTGSPSVETLDAVRSAWVAAKESWKMAEIFNFGPVDQLALQTAIDLWPTATASIETAINNYDGTETYLTGIGSNRKGLPAVEYLLYETDQENVIAQFKTNENRRKYFLLLTSALESQAQILHSEWASSYQSIFNANIGNDANASITLLANEMIGLVEVIKNFKVANPLGLSTSGTPLPNQVESYYAKHSVPLIAKNLDAIEAVFTGGTGNGFDDYLNDLNIEDGNGTRLSEIIRDQINNTRTSLNNIDGSLQEAVIDDKEAVNQLFIDLQLLTVYLKTDMISRLGLVVTFSDNDGD